MESPGSEAMCILVADDDSLIRMVLRHALESVGHEVREAQTGPAAVIAAATTDLSLVILDVHMPGPGFARTLADLHARGIPVLVLSGDTSVTDADPSRNLAYLSKPVDIDELLTTITALDRAAKALRGA